jgi:hypothetical protein
MGNYYDFSKPSKFITDLFSFFRKWKLGRYKKKKVRKERSFKDRSYFVSFVIKVDDPINPQEIEKKYNMVVPAKAAFFAKIKAEESIKNKINIDFMDCELITDDDIYYMESTREEYIKDVAEGKIVND